MASRDYGGICDSCNEWADLLIPCYGQRLCETCAWSQAPGADILIVNGPTSYVINTTDPVMAEPKVRPR